MHEQTASTWASGSFWLIVVFIGAFALLGAIYWAMSHNRVSREQNKRTEQATRDLYDGDTTDRTRGAD